MRPWQRHGFTAEALDSIINYDIKYRPGRDTEDEEEQIADKSRLAQRLWRGKTWPCR